MNYKKIKDTVYKENGKLIQKRYTVRCLLLNGSKIGLLHIYGDDELFGKRNHLETPGGGIDENETPIEALKREMLEETGYKIKNINYLTTISVTYHLLNRCDISKIYYCEIAEDTHNINLLDYEKTIFDSFDFYELDDIENIYKKYSQEGVNKIIFERDLYAIKKLKKILKMEK